MNENQRAWCWLIGGATACALIGAFVGAHLARTWGS